MEFAIFLILVYFLTLITSFQISSNSSTFDEGHGRIAGGVKSTITEHPYLVALEHHSSLICGGSIVTSTLILTAAHCLIAKSPKHIAIRYGSSNLEKGGTVVPAKNFFIHSNFDSQTTRNDIAMIELERPITFSASAKPIQMIRPEQVIDAGFKCTVSGWGKLNTFGPKSDQLQHVHVPLWPIEACWQAYPATYLGKGKLCAGSAGRDSCQADSGGPLVCRGKQIGLVSFGRDCGDPRHPGVYTSVGYYGDWIEMVKSLERRNRERFKWSNTAGQYRSSRKNDASNVGTMSLLSLAVLFAFKLQFWLGSQSL